ncbi:MAG TPA: Abi-alpha family protein [Solirubrobacterales bacterium]|nr:Abi-alpha family protein [Solirubrobacterales bacterium]
MSEGRERGRGGVIRAQRRRERELERAPALPELVRATPGLARIAVAAGRRSAAWAVDAYVRTASRAARAATSGEPAGQFLQETGTELRDYARELLGLSTNGARSRRGDGGEGEEDASVAALRRRGAELLLESTELRSDDLHPAYMRILEALSPDEARVLRFIARGGPQPAVDVRAGLPLASELVSQGHTMIGEEAGCLHAERIHSYLDNLHRLGLIWFSREPVSEPRSYQVLEAQPEVAEALEKGGRTARTVRRSIVLTTFGEDFCATCLPLE